MLARIHAAMTPTSRLRRLVPVIAAALLVAVAGPAAAGEPTEAIRKQVSQALKVLRDPALHGPAHAAERRAAIQRIARDAFDFGEMSRRALGRHWQDRTPAERERFVALFTGLLEKAYFSRIDSYEGDSSIQYVEESVADDTATVRTMVTTDHGTKIPVDYQMHRENARWLVHDVRIEGVSLVANYRTQFHKVITTTSYDELVRRLEGKAGAIPGS
jgi:phospholipid transport system substrate-binding protein